VTVASVIGTMSTVRAPRFCLRTTRKRPTSMIRIRCPGLKEAWYPNLILTHAGRPQPYSHSVSQSVSPGRKSQYEGQESVSILFPTHSDIDLEERKLPSALLNNLTIRYLFAYVGLGYGCVDKPNKKGQPNVRVSVSQMSRVSLV
jgi:hypothetical protein